MKFLCMSCDEQMNIVETIPPAQGGGISVVFACPTCSNRIAMLTNSWETQVVSSLGVRIGGEASAAAAEGGLGQCPFGDVVRQMAVPDPRPDATPAWTSEALARLQKIPESIRPMAQQGIESYAKSQGHERIDEEVLDRARDVFGM